MSDEKIAALEAELGRVREQKRTAEQATKDLRTQLAEATAGSSDVAKQIKALTKERDALALKVEAIDTLGQQRAEDKSALAAKDAEIARIHEAHARHLAMADEHGLPKRARDFFDHEWSAMSEEQRGAFGDDGFLGFLGQQSEDPVYKAFASKAAPAGDGEGGGAGGEGGAGDDDGGAGEAGAAAGAGGGLPSRGAGRRPPASPAGAPNGRIDIVAENAKDPVGFAAKHGIKVQNPERFATG